MLSLFVKLSAGNVRMLYMSLLEAKQPFKLAFNSRMNLKNLASRCWELPLKLSSQLRTESSLLAAWNQLAKNVPNPHLPALSRRPCELSKISDFQSSFVPHMLLEV